MSQSKYLAAMKMMLGVYVNVVVRFALYAAYGYVVARVVVYGYSSFVDPTAVQVWKMKEACPYVVSAMTVYGLVAGFFAVRDGIWTSRAKLIEALKKMDFKA